MEEKNRKKVTLDRFPLFHNLSCIADINRKLGVSKMSRTVTCICVVAMVVTVSQSMSIGGWRERAVMFQRLWMANETGSYNGNENGPGTQLNQLQ